MSLKHSEHRKIETERSVLAKVGSDSVKGQEKHPAPSQADSLQVFKTERKAHAADKQSEGGPSMPGKPIIGSIASITSIAMASSPLQKG